ncbi:MAG: VCBS repeat-containing protein, partial [Acidobacteriota bacterium]|nr:VCBS repeat-containing protein [Acidobacteriota bacterium]
MAARAERLELAHQSIDLPGAPAVVVPADLDGDGRRDLVIVVVYREWGEIGEDRFEDMMEIVEVVPALFDRREIIAYLADADGHLRSAGPPLPIGRDVLSVQEGPPGVPVLALTEGGIARVALSGAQGPALSMTPLLESSPVIAGSETFLPKLNVIDDLDGDGIPDLLFPAPDGLVIYRGTGDGVAESAAAQVPLPGHHSFWGRTGSVLYPLPTVHDVNVDGLPDLVVQASDDRHVHVLLGKGDGSFGSPSVLSVPEPNGDDEKA